MGRVLLTLILSFGPAALADGKGAQAGMLWGYSVPDAENTGQYKLFGVKGEAFFLPTFSAGGYYLLSDKSGDPSSTEKFRYSLHGIQAAYHMNASGGDTFVALRMGLSKAKVTVASEDLTFSPYHFGIATGYDYFLGSMLSVGFEGSFLHVQRGRTVGSTGNVNLDSFNIISFLGTIQLRF